MQPTPMTPPSSKPKAAQTQRSLGDLGRSAANKVALNDAVKAVGHSNVMNASGQISSQRYLQSTPSPKSMTPTQDGLATSYMSSAAN